MKGENTDLKKTFTYHICSIGLGACHGDENLSLFSHFPWISYLVNEDDYSVKDNMNRYRPYLEKGSDQLIV
jgi:hypothetical protein